MKEVVSAFEVIVDFFDSGLPNEHRKDLKKWRWHVINDKQFKNRHGSGYLLSVHNENIRLLEAAHELMMIKTDEKLSDKRKNNHSEQEMKEWVFYPQNLSQKEIANPYLAIKKIFKKIAIEQYNELLNEWLRIALSNRTAGENLTAKEIINVYDNMRKLYSAAWIIHQRECCK